jgi:peptidoglycan/xylan/chitin deacetylase (PgdA/CDA1 family)
MVICRICRSSLPDGCRFCGLCGYQAGDVPILSLFGGNISSSITASIGVLGIRREKKARQLASSVSGWHNTSPTEPMHPVQRDHQLFLTRANIRSFWTFARLLMIGTIALCILLGAEGLALLIAQAKLQAHSKPTIAALTTPTVVSLGQQYMDALLQHKYAVMWSMLHPQVRAMWHDEKTFGRYLQMRFENYTLQGFSYGKVSQLSSWVNPETMREYQDVEIMPISLRLVSRLTPQVQASLAPQFQQPDQLLQNIPFIVQQAADDQWFILAGGPADSEAPILPPIVPVNKTLAVPILMYHYISGVPDNDPDPELRQSLSVSPQLFNRQLDYLKQQGFHSITLNQLMNALYYGVPLPRKPLVLTFDDGYLDGYTAAYPALKAHGFSGMFYVITGKVGWQGQMNWDQLREMVANGMQMGSHTVHHVDMGLTYLASPNLANQEALVAQKDMQDHLGIRIQHFCYPYGEPFKNDKLLLQREIVALLVAHGYVDATTAPGPTGVIQNSLTPFAFLRLRIDGRTSLQSFIHTLENVS